MSGYGVGKELHLQHQEILHSDSGYELLCYDPWFRVTLMRRGANGGLFHLRSFGQDIN
jgi:hypothetical protein